MRRAILAASAALLAAAIATPAEANGYRSEYMISAFGLRIASTRFESVIDGSSYTVNGSMRARGIARLFTTTSGTVTATGRIDEGAVAPLSFKVRYTDGGRDKKTVIAFSGGRVTEVSNRPAVTRDEDWIDVPGAQLVDVLDPIGAMLVPARSMGAVCRRTIRTFSGALRADLRLSHLRTIPFSARGYRGDAVTCRARFVPIAGFNSSKREINAMRDDGRIEISFAPVGQTGLFAPVKARLTYEGITVHVTAIRFEQLTN